MVTSSQEQREDSEGQLTINIDIEMGAVLSGCGPLFLTWRTVARNSDG